MTTCDECGRTAEIPAGVLCPTALCPGVMRDIPPADDTTDTTEPIVDVDPTAPGREGSKPQPR